MTTYTQAVPDAHLATNAGFQAYVQHVISMFTNANPAILTRTADTNQIDALTVASPGSSSTSVGNWAALPALFRFYDGLGNDIYIKVRFGLSKTTSGTTTADLGAALLGITLGRGTDGAGNLTRTYDSREFLMLASSNGNVATSRGVKSSYACARDGFLGVLIERDQKTSSTTVVDLGHFLGISFKDTGEAFTVYCCNTTYARDPVAGTGSDTTTGWEDDYPGSINTPAVAAAFHGRGVKALAFSVETGPWGGWFNTFSAVTRKPPVPSLTTGVWNGNTNLFRIDCYHPEVGTWEDPNMLLYYTGDFSPLDTKTISMDATTKTFIFFTPILRAKFPSNCALAMRWE